MATDHKFKVKNGLHTQNIEFVDSNNTHSITASMLASDTLSFSGNAGQLFSLTDSMSGTIFSVNDVSGIPSIEVDDDGTIYLAENSGNILIGTGTDDGSTKLQVDGSIKVTGFTTSGQLDVGTQNIKIGNNYIYASGDNNSIHVNAVTSFIPDSTTTANNPDLGLSNYRWKGIYGGFVSSSGDVQADTHFTSSDLNATLSSSGSGGNVYLRPNGKSSTSGQVHIASTGQVTSAGDITAGGFLQATGILYTRDNLQVLNTAGTGWNTWATRSNGNYNLSVGTISSGAITSSGDVTLNGKLSIEHDGSNTGDVLSLFSNRFNQASMYGFGLESGTLYYKANVRHQFYSGSNYDNASYDVQFDGSSFVIRTGDLKMGASTFVDESRNITAGTISSGVLDVEGAAGGSNLAYASNFAASGASIQLTLERTSSSAGWGGIGADATYCFSAWRGSGGVARRFGITHSGDANLISGSYQIDGTTVIDSSGNLTNIGTITASGNTQFNASSHLFGSASETTTGVVIRAQNTAGAPARATRLTFEGYESRAQGLFFTDSGQANQEWFAGIPYNASFARFSIGYHNNSSSQPEYTANELFSVDTSNNVRVDNVIFLSTSSTYHQIRGKDGNTAIYLGGSGDNRNYYDSAHHRWRTDNGAVNLGEWSQTGLHIGGITTPSDKLEVTGNASIGDASNISMSAVSAGQLKIKGNGYTGAVALDGSAMHIYHNSSSRSLVLGTNETARLTIGGGGTFNFNNNNLSSIGTISSGAITSSGDITTTADLYLNGGRAIFDTDTGTQPFQLNRIGIGTTHNQSLKMWVDDSYAVYVSEQDETNRYGGHMFRSKYGSTAYTRFQITAGSTSEVLMYNNTGTATWQWDGNNGRQGINKIAPAYTLDVNGTINGTNLRIGTTEVIDSSRNITAGAITSSGDIQFTSQNHKWSAGASGSANNILGKIGGSGAAGVVLKDSANVFRVQLYGEGSNYGFLASEWGAWDFKKTSGGALYLNNNNTYYLQPDSTTNLNNLTVAGNLTVSGTTTTLNTTNLAVEDNNITLNYGTGDTSGSANGAGITIQDAVSSTSNASMTWNATSDVFQFSHGTTFGPNSIDPDSFGGTAGGFGNIVDGSGWGARGLFVHGGGTGDAAAIAHNGNNLYFGIQDGSSANSMDSWLTVNPTKVANFAAQVNVSGHGNSSQWNTAYGWGDHASAGYITGVTAGAGLTGGGSSGAVTVAMAWANSDTFTGTYGIVWNASDVPYTASWLQVRGSDDTLLTRNIHPDGHIRINNGSSAGPSLRFNVDQNTGIFRQYEGVVSFSSDGTNVLDVGKYLKQPYGTTFQFPASTQGWRKLAKIDSRGGGRLLISFTGGNFAPNTYVIDYFKNWSTTCNLKLEQYGTEAYITGVRLRTDSSDSKTYLEIYLNNTSSSTDNSILVFDQRLLGYNSSTTVYTGALSAGSSSGTTHTEMDFLPEGSTFNKVNVEEATTLDSTLTVGGQSTLARPVLVNGANDNSGRADLSVEVGSGPQISLHGSQVQIGGSDMNWNSKFVYDGTTKLAGWDSDIQIFSQGSNTGSASGRDIYFSPQTSGTAAATERMRIKGATGNVGIGNTNPQDKLDVVGSVRITSSATDQTNSADSTTIPATSGADVLRLQGGYTNGTYTTEIAKIDRVGNLPLYIRESRGTANSFTNLMRIGGHGRADGGYTAEVFGDLKVAGTMFATGTVTAQTGGSSLKGPVYIAQQNTTGEGGEISLNGSNGHTSHTLDTVNGTFRIFDANGTFITGNSGYGLNSINGYRVNGTLVIDSNKRLLVSDGSASAPYMTFAADTNTGFYRPATDNIGFAVGGVARAFMSGTQFNMTGNGVFSGSLSVGGSTVIDSSLNLSNINSIHTDNYEDLGGQFLFRKGSGSGTTRHLNLWNSTSDPSNADGTGISGITWGQRTDSQPYYMIYVDRENYSGNYSRLRLNWHTGIQIGASSSYGGTRFYNDARRGAGGGSLIFSVGSGDNHVRVLHNAYVAGNLYLGDGDDGYFYNDTNGRTAFANGDFYIQSSVGNYYNYATNQYIGDSSGDNIYFRGNTLTGNSWSLDGAGVLHAQSFRLGTTAAWKIRPNSGNAQLAFEYSTSSGLSDTNIKAELGSGGDFIVGDRLANKLSGYQIELKKASTSIGDGGSAGSLNFRTAGNFYVRHNGYDALTFASNGLQKTKYANGSNAIYAEMLSTDTLSFSGDSGQLFSLTDSMSGTIFSVNDVSGIPSIEVEDDGTIYLAESTGNVLIGTGTDNGSDKLQISGSLVASGNITAYGSASDINVKENIEVIPDAVEKVQKLEGVTFNYKKDGSRSTGLIAQQLQEVLPEVVYETTDLEGTEHLAVRYGNVVGLLVEAIKEQQTQLTAQEEQINQLTNLVNKLMEK